MRKHEVLRKMMEDKMVAVIRTETEEQALEASRACVRGGIHFLEITFTLPGADRVIRTLSEEYGEDVVIGAGTVLDGETARIAILAGAQFVVSPMLSEDTAKVCNRYGILYSPGIMTITEATHALELGCELIKTFPGNVMGQDFIKAVKSVLPQGLYMPTGGVNKDNVGDWFDAGAVVLGCGGSLLKGYKEEKYDQIEASAADLVQKVREYEESIGR